MRKLFKELRKGQGKTTMMNKDHTEVEEEEGKEPKEATAGGLVEVKVQEERKWPGAM